MAILGILFIIIICCGIILGAIFDTYDTPTDLTEKEKELLELRYDDPAKEGRYRKFRERYEFQERLAKEREIEKDTN